MSRKLGPPQFTPARAVIAGYTGKIQLALIASSAYLIVLFLVWLRKSVESVRLRRKSRRLLVDRLSNLTRDEKLVLQQYILRGCRTWCWEFDDPNVRSLVAYGILFPTSSSGDMRAFPYDVVDAAWKHLNAHPELIHLPEKSLGTGAPSVT